MTLSSAASPSDEHYRLEALRALQLLDTPPEERFDRITRLVKQALNVPVVAISLIDERRQWCKSSLGLNRTELPLEMSLCSHAIAQDELFVIADALEHAGFMHHPLVAAGPKFRFYAGKPLRTLEGVKIGTLCILDTVPRTLSDEECVTLNKFAAWAEREVNATAPVDGSLVRLEHKLRLAHVLEYVAEGIVSADLDGTIETANPSACTMFQYSAQDLVGMNISALIPARDQARHLDYMTRVRAGKPGDARSGLEVTGMRRGGMEFPAEVSFRMLDIGSRSIFTALIRDITERKNHERNKSEFIASVSHELRTPLTAIIGALGMLQEDLFAPMADDVKQLVDVAYRNSQRLNALINDILDVEKLDAGKMNFSPERISLVALLKEIGGMNQPYAKKLDVELSIDLPAQPLFVTVDHLRFSQVLTNLISNACKFSPAQGRVVVSTELNNDLVRINIIDQGPGIADEFRPRMFQRFAQAQPSRDHKQTGTGLGLNLSKAMVDKMGGTIGFISAPGAGSTFYVEFRTTP